MSSLTKKQIEVEESERRRIAKDLHDSLGQQLSAIKLYLGTLHKMQPSTKSSNHKTLVSKSINALDEAISDLSNICFNLMPVTLNAYGLVHATEDLARKISLNKKVKIDVTASKSFPALDKTLEINIFRIMQEFVNNAIKHGSAKHIKLDLLYDGKNKKLVLHFKDDGKGFNVTDVVKYKGSGLQNVQSRVDFHNGTLLLQSNIGSGTTYKIEIPLKKFSIHEEYKGIDN